MTPCRASASTIDKAWRSIAKADKPSARTRTVFPVSAVRVCNSSAERGLRRRPKSGRRRYIWRASGPVGTALSSRTASEPRSRSPASSPAKSTTSCTASRARAWSSWNRNWSHVVTKVAVRSSESLAPVGSAFTVRYGVASDTLTCSVSGAGVWVGYLLIAGDFWRRGSGSNRRIKVLQTSPLPLGYRAPSVEFTAQSAALHDTVKQDFTVKGMCLERETGVEPATSSLARKHSTTELLPLVLI